MLLKIGIFKFEANGASLKKLAFARSHQWDEIKRAGSNPQLQHTGTSATCTISGTLFPTKGRGSKDSLRQLDTLGTKPQLLVSGIGENLGYWVITNTKENIDLMFKDGTPRKITYSISLKFYGNKL